MQTKSLFFTLVTFLSCAMTAVRANEGDVFKATKIFQQIVPTSPFLITKTEMVTWTQSASITTTTTATPIPETIEAPKPT
ncbi:hypothetical protein DFP72DRAFT_1077386 [Ephemerocybe angulata]|uniref:Uncharacterized protein n=1 Tax=Ephemerocybe angulata TaxID=980116 RepID=A0A8H6LVM8_9AGAR|nr:hypothetical protein DFP72DRAFT_1077386 [Tulosesus angulatus]